MEEDGLQWELKNALKIQKIKRLFDLRRVDPNAVKTIRTLPVLPKDEDKDDYEPDDHNLLDDDELRPLSGVDQHVLCLLYTSPSPRDGLLSRMPSSA